MTDVEPGGVLARTLREVARYPKHPPRKPSALYKRNHRALIREQDRPCLICGVRNSTLKDPEKNPRGSKQMETHHRLIEDSLALAIDLEKFNRRVRPGLLRHSNDEAKYGHDFTQDEMEEWIHGDLDNLWVLCDTCHRHPLVGIHAITFPIFNVQDLLFDSYDLTGYVAPTPEEAAQLTALPVTTGQAQAPKTSR